MVSAQEILGVSTETTTRTQKIKRACKSKTVFVLFQAVKLGNCIHFLMMSNCLGDISERHIPWLF